MTSSGSQSGYRRDIDGLRAIAILPVLFYHAKVGLFPGGYIGVDVFFVISGYLIAGIIAREIDDGRFSLLKFYERRARRIMPALMVVLVLTLCAAAYVYFPGDFKKVPPSALMTLAFVSNVGFFMETGYFAGGAETMPLLQTWSLAVEEQFYIGFPLLLILIARFMPTRRFMIIAVIALISFSIAVATQSDGTGSAFYLLPARAWELFVGALLATSAIPKIATRWLREGIAFLGLAAIAYAALFFTHTTTFPGVNALFPVLGSAALIHSAQRTVTGRLLETAPLVGVGLISYSLYLWHWPLIVFTEYIVGQKLSGMQSAAVILVSLIAAFLSWRFVERPFRSSTAFDRAAIFKWTGGSIAIAATFSLGLMATDGWPSRFLPQTLRLDAARGDISPARDICMTGQIGGLRPECSLGAAVAPTAILWGDSHGAELAWALSENFAKRGASLMQRTRGSCPPILGYQTTASGAGCVDFNQNVFETIQANKDLKTVILVAVWAGGAYEGPEDVKRLDQTIRRLRALNRKVILIGAVPPQSFNVPRHLAKLAQAGKPTTEIAVLRPEFPKQTAWLRARYPRWRSLGVTIVEPAEILCKGENCAIARAGQPLYFDAHHLSLSGARLIAGSAQTKAAGL